MKLYANFVKKQIIDDNEISSLNFIELFQTKKHTGFKLDSLYFTTFIRFIKPNIMDSSVRVI